MADRVLAGPIVVHNGIATKWTTNNKVLLKAELGFEADSNRFKIGDGITPWNSLPYALGATATGRAPAVTDTGYVIGSVWLDTNASHIYSLVAATPTAATWKRVVTSDELAALGAGDMLKDEYDANDDGKVDAADEADKLSAARTFALTGDATGTQSSDLSADLSIAVTLANSGVTAGTYPVVTVDAKGRVTEGAQLTASDIPSLTLAKITDAGTAAQKDVGTTSGNVVEVGADGKIDTNLLPSLPDMHATFSVAVAADLVTLTTAKLGDTAIAADTGDMYRLAATPPTTAANWKKVTNAADGVTSWAGKTGAINPTTDDVSESANKYYTDERVTTLLGITDVAALRDGAHVLMDTDTYIWNGGEEE